MKKKFIICIIILFFLPSFCLGFIDPIQSLDDLNVIKDDYSRDDLLFILGIGSDNDMTCTWEISKDELNKEKMQDLSSLLSNLSIQEYLNVSDYFINNAYKSKYRNQMYFQSFEIMTANDSEFGVSKSINRNDWIIVMTYANMENTFTEKILLTSGKRIIISSNNYEEV